MKKNHQIRFVLLLGDEFNLIDFLFFFWWASRIRFIWVNKQNTSMTPPGIPSCRVLPPATFQSPLDGNYQNYDLLFLQLLLERPTETVASLSLPKASYRRLLVEVLPKYSSMDFWTFEPIFNKNLLPSNKSKGSSRNHVMSSEGERKRNDPEDFTLFGEHF